MTRARFDPDLPSPPLVLQLLPALGDGGVEQSTIDMALYLTRHQWPVVVASSGGSKTALLEKAGVVHHRLPLASKAPWTIIANAWRIRKIITQHDVGLIHARSRGPAWSGWLAGRMTGVPFLTTFHGTYSLKGGWLKRFYNSVMLRSPVVIANSRFIARHIFENYQYPADQIVVAPRGIDEEKFNPAQFKPSDRQDILRELDVPEKTPLLVMVGRLTSWKGHELLLRAMSELRDQPWVLALVGGPEKDGRYAREMQALAHQLGIGDRVRFTGSRKDVARLLHASTLALSCSVRPEAFGRVAIEGMAMGVPVVATAIGGSLETVVDGKTGFLVRPDGNGEIQPQRLAKTIGEALRDPARLARMGKDARAHVLAHYTADLCCASEMRAYRRLLKMRPPQE